MFASIIKSSRRMMSSDTMPRVDPSELSRSQLNYIKHLQAENTKRVLRVRQMRTRNVQTGVGLGIFVVLIFTFTIYRVQNETFLDED